MAVQMGFKKLSERACIPTYGSEGAACVDLYAVEDITIYPGELRIVRSGLAMEIPEGYYLEMFNRSSMAGKRQVVIVSSRVVDSDFRGELICPMKNIGTTPVTIEVGDRFAQMMIKKVEKMEFVEVDELSNTQRGEGGFGSTGK